jgi:hypothetical protein
VRATLACDACRPPPPHAGYAPASSSTQLDMLMMRNSAARSWSFWHKNPTDGQYVQGTSGSTTLLDSQLTAYTGWSVVSRRDRRARQGRVRLTPCSPPLPCDHQANWRVGLVAGMSQSYWNAALTFDHFRTGNATTFVQQQAWAAYWATRNATIAASGICAVGRSFERTFSSTDRTYLARGLVSTEQFR